ncbi:MAG TPA: BMP family ABC transporter substrate-binding protein [Sediminispirochaeta sp.]|nr:BMP family ABC transporter substrate-binding protein [Sediminispirochaeta sp.]
MKKTKKLGLVFLAVILAISVISCGKPPEQRSSEEEAAESSERASGEGLEERMKVALLLTATIDDEGWSQTSYRGFKRAEEDFGFKGAYTESIALPDQEAVVRNYATSGYEVIVLSSADFTDVALNMAEKFPDIKFILINGHAAQEPNLANYRPLTIECGFIAGAFSAMVSENGAVGIVNGQKFPPVEDAGRGFEAGAKYINPNTEVRVAYTDSWTDVQKANEAALSMIESGVDVLASNCSNGVAGVLDAAVKNDALVTGYIGDQYEMAPGTVPFSAIQDIGMVVYSGIRDVVNDNFKPKLVPVGVKEGVIRLSDFYTIGDEPVPAEIQEKMNEIYQGIKDGSLKTAGHLPKSVFEE